MTPLLRLFAQISLLRRGPQDIPASPVLLLATVFGYIAVTCLVSALLPPSAGPWLLPLIIEVLFLLAWYAVLLRLVRRPERFLQTTTALFGYQTLLAPPLIASSWLIQQFEKDSAWFLPASLIALVLVIWKVAAGSHVLRAALEWSMPASVAVMILQVLAVESLLLAMFAPVRP